MAKKEQIPIRLYNTATRKKQLFKPMKKGKVSMYNCGPTVYDYAHIGHMFAYVFVDVLKRTMEFNGLKMRAVMNITDVGHLTSDADTGEDKIEKAAREKKMDAWRIAAYYTNDFFDAMKKLNVKRADVVCKATGHVKQMIELVQAIEKNGMTYKTSDGIYFNTSKFKGYPKFAQLNLKKLKAGARVEKNPEKKNPTDFALWKFSPKGSVRQMEWKSPWGIGFPGWHIECTAMSMHYLGEVYDIHTGGIDHIPIHHTNEIAQAYGATKNAKFVNYWMHNNFIVVDGQKMSKSKKNFYNMADIEAKGFDPIALRYLFIAAHYRTKVNFTWESLQSTEKALNTLRNHIIEWRQTKDKIKSDRTKIASYKTDFLKAINDDLNTPKALSVLWKLVRDKEINEKDKLKIVLKFDEVLGLRLDKVRPVGKTKLSEEVMEWVEKRDEFRKKGKYEESDEIRRRLKEEFGIVIEDTAKGTKWKVLKDKKAKKKSKKTKAKK